MCGILVNYPNYKFKTFELSELVSSLETIKHRGPDSSNYYFNQGVFLGHNRLSIVDLDQRSNQPFFFKQYIIVFNGEIFNYLEIRELLTLRGITFETNSDTEVLLKAFIELGASMYDLLNGFWSFVIYDIEQDILHVSRDRFGQKPLFMKEYNGGFLFSSEIKPIIDLSPSNPNLKCISNYLLFSYDELNETFFEGITFFETAHHYIYKKGEFSEKFCFWRYPENITMPFDNDRFNELLNDSVKIRMSKDVGFMIAGSSGMDSSLIQSIISNNFKDNNSKLSIITYSDMNPILDESDRTQKIAHLFGNNCIVVKEEFKYIDFKEELLNIIKNAGMGFPSTAILSYNALLKRVNHYGVKVLIEGQGGDECLGGYSYLNYFTFILYFLKKRKPKIALELIIKLIKDPMGIYLKFSNFMRLILPRFFLIILSPNSRYFYFNFLQFKKKRKKVVHSDKVNRFLIFQHQYILQNLLYYGDIISMKNSVESRSPFLDHRLIDYLFRTDYVSKYNSKSGFKAALFEHPNFNCFNHLIDKRKLGFNTTFNESMILEMLHELKNSQIFSLGILIKSRVQNLINKKLRGENIDFRFLFRVYQVHLWVEIFNKKIDKNEKMVN
jgi:asparagine synthase (glutamine-hydrolysing)